MHVSASADEEKHRATLPRKRARGGPSFKLPVPPEPRTILRSQSSATCGRELREGGLCTLLSGSSKPCNRADDAGSLPWRLRQVLVLPVWPASRVRKCTQTWSIGPHIPRAGRPSQRHQWNPQLALQFFFMLKRAHQAPMVTQPTRLSDVHPMADRASTEKPEPV